MNPIMKHNKLSKRILLAACGSCAFVGYNVFAEDPVDTNQTAPSQNIEIYDEILSQTDGSIEIESIELVDETIMQTLALVERLTNRTLIAPSNLPAGKINFLVPRKITLAEAIAGIKSVLNANGISIAPLGDKYFRAIQVNKAKSTAPELIMDGKLGLLSPSQEICSYMFILHNLTAREAARLVYSSLTPGSSSVVTLDKANALLITDTVANLQRLDSIFKKIDKVGEFNDELLFFELKNVSAKDLKTKLDALQRGALKRYLYGNTSFEEDSRTNQLISVCPPGISNFIKDLVTKFDIGVSPLTKSQVFRLKHGDSKNISELIKKIVQQYKEKAEKIGGLEETAETPNPSANANNAGSSFAKFSSQVSVECDERINAVVAYGTPTDLRQIGDLIDQLDVVLPQVRIDVIIAEVTLTDSQASGLDAFDLNYAGKGSTFKPSFAKGKLSANPLTFNKAIPVDKFTLDMVINAANVNSNVSILSSPTLLTTHNREANVRVVETRPYVSATRKSGTASSDSDLYNEIKQEEAGIELTVKPLIGLNGVVQLEIKQDVNNFYTNTNGDKVGGVTLPFITKRSAKSFVSARSSEVIVLAGLKRREIENENKKMFLLGDLPLLGPSLFSSKGKHESIKELIIFIRPNVLSDTDASNTDAVNFTETLSFGTKKDVKHFIESGQFSESNLKYTEENPAQTNSKSRRKFKNKPATVVEQATELNPVSDNTAVVVEKPTTVPETTQNKLRRTKNRIGFNNSASTEVAK